MRRVILILALIAILYGQRTQPLIIDHNTIDLASIPMEWIESVQADAKMHYAHTSHGGQLTGGLELLEGDDAEYDIAIGYSSLPTTSGAFCIYDGQSWGTYIGPTEYWETHDGMEDTRYVLDSNPSINYSMFCWCGQMGYYSEDQVYAYLDSMETLEAEYPDVTFILFTGHAQYSDWDGYTRHHNNNIIRQYALDNNKILFDFADIDCHYDGELYTYEYDGEDIPLEHPHYAGEEMAHTSYENCRNKGRAFWWMMARLSGWPGIASVKDESAPLPEQATITAYPNPFNSSVNIAGEGNIRIFDSSGRLVDRVTEGCWSPKGLESGIYTAISEKCQQGTSLVYMK